MQMFSFGQSGGATDKKRRVAEYALHVQCAWCLVGADGIVAADNDYYYPPGDPDHPPDGWEWDRTNRCDERMSSFVELQSESPLVVRGIRADGIGGLQVRMNHRYLLEVFPNNSQPDEHWRFFSPGRRKRHFVVTGLGIL